MVDDTGSYPTEIVGQFHNVNFLELFLLHPALKVFIKVTSSLVIMFIKVSLVTF